MSDPRETQSRGHCLPQTWKGWEEGVLEPGKPRPQRDSHLPWECKRDKCLPPQALTSFPGRFYTGAWGHCTGNNPEPTASFSKQCRILLTGLKSGTEHRGEDLGSPNTHTQHPAPLGSGTLAWSHSTAPRFPKSDKQPLPHHPELGGWKAHGVVVVGDPETRLLRAISLRLG